MTLISYRTASGQFPELLCLGFLICKMGIILHHHNTSLIRSYED